LRQQGRQALLRSSLGQRANAYSLVQYRRVHPDGPEQSTYHRYLRGPWPRSQQQRAGQSTSSRAAHNRQLRTDAVEAVAETPTV
jgi:hypothetical protein